MSAAGLAMDDRRSMRLILMGTGPFGMPSFEALYASRHEILAVVTAPPRPPRGRKPAPPSPVRVLAEARGTPILDPRNVNADAARESLTALRRMPSFASTMGGL